MNITFRIKIHQFWSFLFISLTKILNWQMKTYAITIKIYIFYFMIINKLKNKISI